MHMRDHNITTIHMALYNDFVQNLVDFVDSLDETRIKIMFLKAGAPVLRTQFRKWNTRYVCCGRDRNYVYVYAETDLKLTLDAPETDVRPYGGPQSARPQNVGAAIKGPIRPPSADKGDVNIGHHIDWSVRGARSGVFFGLHKTIYEYDPDHACFYRTAPFVCNFNYDGRIKSKEALMRCKCAVAGRELDDKTVFSEFRRDFSDMEVIWGLYEATTTHERVHHGSGSLVHRGPRGGRFIFKNGQKMYLKGGASTSYKGVTFVSQTFGDYVQEKMVEPLASLDFLEAKLIYDEMSELNPRGNEHFVMLFDFDDGITRVFYVDAVMALVGCYASVVSVTTGGSLTAHERSCKEAMDAWAHGFRTQFATQTKT